MAYKTLKHIRDLKDKEHYYRVGETYPREGLEVSEERLAELVKIEAIELVEDDSIDNEVNLTRLNKTELVELAENREIEIDEADTKADIIEKLGE